MDSASGITVEIANRQTNLPLDDARLEEAVRMILEQEAITHAQISVAVVDDATICELNRKYLARDEPTDVLSFVLERSQDHLEGEVVVSAETAELAATWFNWPAQDELLLYVIHGTLHLVGYGDTTPERQTEMREWERLYLACFGVEGHYEGSDAHRGPHAPSKTSVSGGKRLP